MRDVQGSGSTATSCCKEGTVPDGAQGVAMKLEICPSQRLPDIGHHYGHQQDHCVTAGNHCRPCTVEVAENGQGERRMEQHISNIASRLTTLQA